MALLFNGLAIAHIPFYLCADGPRFRRVICSVLPPRTQRETLRAWEIAIEKTGGYLYSRALLALVCAGAHYAVLVVLDIPFAFALALWVGVLSQFIPTVGTYIGGAVPVLVALLVGVWPAVWVLVFVIVYQQFENYLLQPRITAKTLDMHPAVAFAIVVLSLGRTGVSLVAITAGLAVALLVYALAFRGGVAGTRLILIGIGIAAMLDSLTSYVLSQAAEWDLQEAMRWLTGSLNGSTWTETVPVLLALAVLAPLLLSQSRNLSAMQLGDDTASALGVRVERTRIIVIVAAVGLIAFATAAAGPIAFVAFLSGPIAARIVGPGGSLLVPSALVGALLVLVADLAGQYAFGTRFPVGVVTGVLGAPYLVYLIVRTNRAGGSL
ncbi:iron chelate uptake ABC transporter family permease subunit, partial [Nocardiopsis tropica]|nr:iron chelate uptake ABC transporter family permease subunit [Nocardiopsis tropica]